MKKRNLWGTAGLITAIFVTGCGASAGKTTGAKKQNSGVGAAVAAASEEGAAEKLPDDLYQFSNVSINPQKYLGTKVTGEIKLTNANVNVGYNDVKRPTLVCVLKNNDNKIVGGFEGYLSSDLQEGVPAVFDISGYHELGKYDKAEVYANP